VRISSLYGGNDAKLSCGRLFNPELDSGSSKRVAQMGRRRESDHAMIKVS
jgi:hypothetical protein